MHIKPSLGGVIVFYNPTQDDIRNANLVSQYLDRLIVVDNSDYSLGNSDMLNGKIEYILLSENRGISTAFNIGFLNCCGIDFFVTLDQDSRPTAEYFKKMRSVIQSCDLSDVFIVSPKHVEDSVASGCSKNYEYSAMHLIEVKYAMSSGCMINCELVREVGLFDDLLFLDYVDYDICLRARLLGYKILLDKNNKMEHSLGNLQHLRFFGKNITFTNHSPIRRYYSSRNRLLMYKRYAVSESVWVLEDAQSFVMEIMKIIFFEKSKVAKLKMTLRGLCDFFSNRLGKFEEERYAK